MSRLACGAACADGLCDSSGPPVPRGYPVRQQMYVTYGRSAGPSRASSWLLAVLSSLPRKP